MAPKRLQWQPERRHVLAAVRTCWERLRALEGRAKPCRSLFRQTEKQRVLALGLRSFRLNHAVEACLPFPSHLSQRSVESWATSISNIRDRRDGPDCRRTTRRSATSHHHHVAVKKFLSPTADAASFFSWHVLLHTLGWAAVPPNAPSPQPASHAGSVPCDVPRAIRLETCANPVCAATASHYELFPRHPPWDEFRNVVITCWPSAVATASGRERVLVL
jgi:hypothetical protein